jgi:copper resistance protein D
LEATTILLVKIALFAAMICLAAINRLRLTPRLPAPDALCRIQRNSAIEVGFGLCIIGIVAALGALKPAIHSGFSVMAVAMQSENDHAALGR